jgi:hypothetical protein
MKNTPNYFLLNQYINIIYRYREVSKFLSQMRSFAGNAEIPPMELSNATKKVMDDVIFVSRFVPLENSSCA